MQDLEILAVAKTYTKETVIGMGALKGAPCTVQGVVDAGDGTQTLTLKWTDDNGVAHTTDISLPSAIFEITSPSNGQTLRYNSTSGKFENSNVSFSADLEDLDNVVITSAQNGQVLTYDAANNRWINADGSTVGELADLTDVVITTAQNGQFLSYDGTSGKWINVTLDIDAADVDYDNTTSGLTATDVQGAIDEIKLDISQLSASKIGYDGTASGLSANKVQGAIDELADEKVDKETGKGLSANDFTNTLKTKLDGIEDGAEVNEIDTVKVNGTALTPDANKAVNIEEKISKLSDVDLTDLADGMILIYDATNNKWYASANTGASYTAGEGIEIDQNNVISSKIVLFTGTEAQWNALPLADKIKFTHYATNDDQTGQIDPVPTQNSNNLMTSGGIYTALADKANTSDLGTAAAKDSTNAVTQSSTDLVESGAVYNAIDNAVKALDVTDAAVAGSYVTAVSETDGAISVTREAADATPTESSNKLLKSGGAYTALADKADKVTGATANNFAGLDANGNLTDSSSKASDFASATTVANIQAVIPSNASQSNKLLAAASEVTPTFAAVKTSSTVDFPIILNETANENYKGIKVTMNDVQKYLMTFKSNHLYLTSYDSDGTTKIVDDVQLDPVNTITSGSRTAVTSGAVYSAINDFTSGSTNVTNVNWVKIGRVVILSVKGHNNSGSSPIQENVTGAPTPLNGTYELAVTMHADPTNGVAGYIQVQGTAITIKTNANMNAYGSLVYFSAS